jgi:hypothetical protein
MVVWFENGFGALLNESSSGASIPISEDEFCDKAAKELDD